MTDPEHIRFAVLVDANVLAKPVTRTLIMAAAARSGYGATWSQYEEDEANRHTRSGQTSTTTVRTLASGELSPIGVDAGRFATTSAKDRQVLADAVAAGALFIVTEDVDDFGQADLEAAGVAAVNPDLFLSIRATQEGYLEALTFMTHRFRTPARTVAQLHVRLGRAHPLTVAARASLFPDDEPLSAAHNPPAEMYRGNRCLGCLQICPVVETGLCSKCASQPQSD
ncbi:MAG: hypothetical protein FWF75_06065 [Propionibacteriaceae bacterium]|nr:hypothetical protein [Propionibacteriaceae bacterium]